MDKRKRRLLGLKKARKLLRVYRNVFHYSHTGFYDEGGEYEKHLLKTRVPCSCMMCGNRRRWMGRTRQEKIADLDLKDD